MRDKIGRFMKGNIPKHTKQIDFNEIIKLYKEGMTMEKISKKFGYKGTNKRIFEYIKSSGLSRSVGFQKGHHSYLEQNKEKNHNWKGGFTKRHGYIMMLHKNKQIHYHQYLWCIENGIPFIPKGWIVHHRNKNKLDNKSNNLLLVPRNLHTQWHNEIAIKENPELKYFGKNIHLRGV